MLLNQGCFFIYYEPLFPSL